MTYNTASRILNRIGVKKHKIIEKYGELEIRVPRKYLIAAILVLEPNRSVGFKHEYRSLRWYECLLNKQQFVSRG